MKKVLVITTSERKGSNSSALGQKFADGAKAAGNQVQLVSLRGLSILPCLGCYCCASQGRCAQADDAPAIVQAIKEADVIAFATPVYFYEMCGQMKTLLDRTVAIYDDPENRFTDIYLLTTAAEEDPAIAHRVEAGLQGWIDCFPRARHAGTVFAGGIQDPDAIVGNPALESAYQLGKGVK